MRNTLTALGLILSIASFQSSFAKARTPFRATQLRRSSFQTQDIMKLKPEAVRSHQAESLSSLVNVDKDNNKTTCKSFEDHRSTLLDMMDLSYHVAKLQGNSDALKEASDKLNQGQGQKYRKKVETYEGKLKKSTRVMNTHLQKLSDEGWDLSVFEGETGSAVTGYVNDDRGFIAYHPELNKFMIVFHGSRSTKDWDANFDGKLVSADSLGLNLPGLSVHRGFGNAVKSCQTNYKDALNRYIGKLKDSGHNLKETEFFVSGHSQGAALASIAFADLASNFGRQIYGDDYDNSVSNNFKSYIVSTPRAFSVDSVDALHDLVGKDNMIRQNVWADLVPHASLKKVGQVLSYVGDVLNPFAQKKLKGTALQGMMENGQDFLTGLKSYSGYASAGHLALDNTSETLGRKVKTDLNALWQRSKTQGVVKGVKSFTSGITKTLLAPIHYGSTEKGGCGFDQNVVSQDTNKLLSQGSAWRKIQNKAKKSLPGMGTLKKLKSFFTS